MNTIENLANIVKKLRSPEGCPWDKEQTFKSLIPCIIEEAYELVDAIESENINHIKEELGDVLLHVVMLSTIAEENQQFNYDDVANDVGHKMIRRHPHVFGDAQADTVEDVWKHWETIKKTETSSHSIMDNIPKLPALLEAQKVQKKAQRAGFDWDDKTGVIDKLNEEIREFTEACALNDRDAIEDEAGDVLFSIVNVLRKMNINAEDVLRKSNKKFVNRFQKMEEIHSTSDFTHLNFEDKVELWNAAKQQLNH